jgi:2-iminobutanoate/2-iminopropanoate deaminase
MAYDYYAAVDNRLRGENRMAVNRRKFLKGTGASAMVAATTASAFGQNEKVNDARESAKTAKAASSQTRKTQAPVNARPKRRVLTDQAPKPVGPYSQAIISGNTIYVAGQGPMDPKTGNIEVKTFEEQAKQTFESIKAIVEAAGSSLAKVVSVRIYLADLNDFSKLNAIYRQYFTEDYPARTTIGAQLLLGMLIEVDCVAII